MAPTFREKKSFQTNSNDGTFNTRRKSIKSSLRKSLAPALSNWIKPRMETESSLSLSLLVWEEQLTKRDNTVGGQLLLCAPSSTRVAEVWALTLAGWLAGWLTLADHQYHLIFFRPTQLPIWPTRNVLLSGLRSANNIHKHKHRQTGSEWNKTFREASFSLLARVAMCVPK